MIVWRRKGIVSFFMSMRFLQPRRYTGAAWLLLSAMLLLLAGLWSPQPAHAQAGITSPTNGTAVSGDVAIMGTAVIDPFQKYELHYKLEPSGNDAYIYFYGATTPVVNGQLGIWQAGGLPPGTYSLRLRVVKMDGNYAEYYTQNLSVNQGPQEPTPTPTSSEPTATPIPTATFTPAPQPTVAVGQVAQPALDAPPTPTPTVAAVAAVPNTGDTASQPVTTTLAAVTNVNSSAAEGSLTRELGEALSINRLRSQFFNGMRISAALFLGVIALYAGKRLFDWVWTQFS
jgi:hypothetical protein